MQDDNWRTKQVVSMPLGEGTDQGKEENENDPWNFAIKTTA